MAISKTECYYGFVIGLLQGGGVSGIHASRARDTSKHVVEAFPKHLKHILLTQETGKLYLLQCARII